MNDNVYTDLKLNLDTLIGKYLEKNLFTACSIGFIVNESNRMLKKTYNYGKTGKYYDTNFVSEKTFFDLASLTKPLVTALSVLFLVDMGALKLDDSLSKFFKSAQGDKGSIKIYHLLSHTSGLPAHRPYYMELMQIPFEKRWKHVEKKIFTENVCFEPGQKCIYSDLGFILLGLIVEKITGEKLDVFWKKFFINYVGNEKDFTFSSEKIAEENVYVETGICPWSQRKLRGLVNDDNCRALGGVAGHAGLFATPSGLLSFVEKIMLEIQGKGDFFGFSKDIKKTFYIKNKNSSWINGFDTPSLRNSSSGKYFSNLSFGHLGFTGTSFWIDTKKSCAVILLTNRVLCCEDTSHLRLVRPTIHNMVMENISKHLKKNKNFKT